MSIYQPSYNALIASESEMNDLLKVTTDPEQRGLIYAALTYNNKAILEIIKGGQVAGQPIKQN